MQYNVTKVIDVQYSEFTIFKGYTPFIVIIKYWLYSTCCTIHPCSLFFCLIVCTSYLPVPLYCPSPPPHLTVRGQKAGEAKVTANRPQVQDPNPGSWTPRLELLATKLRSPRSRQPQLLLAGLSFCPLLMLWFSSGYSPSSMILCIHPCIN